MTAILYSDLSDYHSGPIIGHIQLTSEGSMLIGLFVQE